MNKSIAELNKLYTDAEEVDQTIFAEMRSNILLVAGDHYTKKSGSFDRVRDQKTDDGAKLRLTQNHIQRISKIYVNAITSMAPGVGFKPANEKEHEDQKAAMLHDSVWEHHKKNHKIRSKVFEWASDYVNFGECAVKIYWDWQKGVFKGYEKKQTEVLDENDEPVLDPATGEPQVNEEDDTTKPVWSGDLVFERIFAFNLFRPRTAQSMEEAEWIGIRKMTNLKELQQLFADDEAKLDMLDSDGKSTYLVFDAHRGNYEMAKDQIMLREIYYRPSNLYPNGYYYVFTNSGILWEGELPFGIFPIVWCGFDQLPTTPRALSPIKVWKPFQVELNRVVSKMAEHQITLGDDKIVVGNNAKISSAGSAPGLRAYSVNGPSTPVVLQGRTGDQYLPYAEKTLKDLYLTAMVAEMLEEKMQAQVDPYAMLLQTARWKQKFSIYSEKFGAFMVDIATLAMELTRRFISPESLIPMIGRQEMVNVAEFKNAKPLRYQIQVEEQGDDVESRMGKQLTLNHIIQFAGQNLDKEDLGKLFRQLPYLNNEEMMSDLTMNYDKAQNMILALERGEQPQPNQFDDAPYMIKRLTKRMGDPDFRFLAPPVQQNYGAITQMYQQIESDKQVALQRAQQGFIPTDGYLVTTQVYAPDPKNPNVTRPLKLPYAAIVWTAKQLEAQGMSQQALQMMGQGAPGTAQMMLARGGGPQPGAPGATPPGAPPPPQGARPPAPGQMNSIQSLQFNNMGSKPPMMQ